MYTDKLIHTLYYIFYSSVAGCHPTSMSDVGWEPEILSPIAQLAAGLYYNILSPQNTRAFQGTGSRIFSNEKLPKLH